jgi:hypothetical protein
MSKDYLTTEQLENQPAKPSNKFMIFRGDHYNNLKAKNQDKTMTEITKMISEMYNDLDPKRMKVPLLIHLILGVRKTS